MRAKEYIKNTLRGVKWQTLVILQSGEPGDSELGGSINRGHWELDMTG